MSLNLTVLTHAKKPFNFKGLSGFYTLKTAKSVEKVYISGFFPLVFRWHVLSIQIGMVAAFYERQETQGRLDAGIKKQKVGYARAKE